MGAPDPYTLSQRDIQALADRLYSRGVSTLAVSQTDVRCDLISASRTLRALLRQYELATGRPLQTVLLCGRL
jgi:hypothetical protein